MKVGAEDERCAGGIDAARVDDCRRFSFPAGVGEERVIGAPGAYHDRSTVDQKLYDGGGLRPAERRCQIVCVQDQ